MRRVNQAWIRRLLVWSQERQVVLADRSSSRSPDSSAPSILLLELRSQPSNLGQRIWGQQGREANGAHATVSLLWAVTLSKVQGSSLKVWAHTGTHLEQIGCVPPEDACSGLVLKYTNSNVKQTERAWKKLSANKLTIRIRNSKPALP